LADLGGMSSGNVADVDPPPRNNPHNQKKKEKRKKKERKKKEKRKKRKEIKEIKDVQHIFLSFISLFKGAIRYPSPCFDIYVFHWTYSKKVSQFHLSIDFSL
jgi:hypothetical protein